MYSLDINFLKERASESQVQTGTLDRTGGGTIDAQPINWLPAIGGGVVGLVFVGGVFLYNNLVAGQVDSLQSEVAALEGQLQALQASRATIEQERQALSEQEALTEALVDIFDAIVPVSALLQDVVDRLPPGVQIGSLSQDRGAAVEGSRPVGNLSLEGIATTYEAANYLALALARSGFVEPKTARLGEIAETSYPINNVEDLPEGVEAPAVYGYVLTADLNRDFSASELLDELQSKGADGLALRIQVLRDRGLVPNTNAAEPNEGTSQPAANEGEAAE